MAGTPRPDRPDPASPRIGDCVAEFHVTAPDGPLSSPELLLQALRQEVLPVLPQVLESPPLSQADIHVPSLDIDLGHWPDDPDWADLRAVFAHKLRLALLSYLPDGGSASDRDGIATILAMSPADLRRYLATYPAMAANIARWREGEGRDAGDAPALSPALRARLDDLMRAAMSEGGEVTTARQRLLRQLWQLPQGEHDDPSRLIAALKTGWPQLFHGARAELASAQDQNLLDEMATGDGEDTQSLRDLKAALIGLFADAGLAPEAATAQAVRLMAALALRIGPATLERSDFRPAPVPTVGQRDKKSDDGDSKPALRLDAAGSRMQVPAPNEAEGSVSVTRRPPAHHASSEVEERKTSSLQRGVDHDGSSYPAGDIGRDSSEEPGDKRPADEPPALSRQNAPDSDLPLPPRDRLDARATEIGAAVAGESDDRPAIGWRSDGTKSGTKAGRETSPKSPSTLLQPGTHAPGESRAEHGEEAMPHVPASRTAHASERPGADIGEPAVEGDAWPTTGHSAKAETHKPATDRNKAIGSHPSPASKPAAREAADVCNHAGSRTGPRPSSEPRQADQSGSTDQRPDDAANADSLGARQLEADRTATHEIDDGLAAHRSDDARESEAGPRQHDGSGAGRRLDTGTAGSESEGDPNSATARDAERTLDRGRDPGPATDGGASEKTLSPPDSNGGALDTLSGEENTGSDAATSGGNSGTAEPIASQQHASLTKSVDAESSGQDRGRPAVLSGQPADMQGGEPDSGRPASTAADMPRADGIDASSRVSQAPESPDMRSARARKIASQDSAREAAEDDQRVAAELTSLRFGKVDLTDLRTRWGRDHAAMNAALSGLETRELLGLVRRLLPSAAGILRASIEDLADGIDAPKPALLHILRNLLDHVAIDLDAAREAARRAMPGPAAMTEQASDSRDSVATARHARRTAIAAMMRLVGITEPVIRRLLGAEHDPWVNTGTTPDDPVTDGHDRRLPSTPDRSRDVTTPAASGAEMQAQPDHVPPDAGDRIEALLDAGLDPSWQDLRASLSIILAAWPWGGGNQPAEAEADLRQRRLWRMFLERLLDQVDATIPRETPAVMLETALILIEPDEAARLRALRYVAARLGYGAATGDAALRQRTRRSIAALLRPATGEGKQAAGANPVAATGTELLVTESAGVILLHPFLRLLFDRLGVLTPEAGLEVTGLPKALAALRALDGRPAQRGLDPLHRLLLGMPEGAPAPRQETLDEAARDLIEGLLRSVIGHWGRLGKTSPDGLRETFLQRPGTLRFDDTGAHLRVTPGPFDMLLDGLPWSLGTVALPWMAVPCHVRWRDRDE